MEAGHRRWLLVGGALVLLLAPSLAREGQAGSSALLRCQQRVSRTAQKIVTSRQRALSSCLAAARACENSGDACEAARARCVRRLLRAEASQSKLLKASGRCLHRTNEELLGDDGLAWAALSNACTDDVIEGVSDAIGCLQDAIVCAADVGIYDTIPDAKAQLALVDVTIDRSCLAPGSCGNGFFEGAEECDDGNLRPGDGCNELCVREDPDACGNGVLDPTEECDDGAANSDALPDHCRTTCREPYCGDGVVDPEEVEECEPPGTTRCDPDCFIEIYSFPAALRAGGSCEAALADMTRRITRKVQRQVDACVLGIARCSLGNDDPSDRCLARAERRCARTAARRARLPVRAAAQLAGACDEDLVALTERLDQAACAAEHAISRAMPRADDLLFSELFDVDGDEAFPCIIDLTDLE